MSELFCPGCSAELDERQLSMTYVVTEKCPRCRTVVRHGDGFRYSNPDAIAADDIESISTWLAAEAKEHPMQVEQIRDDESMGDFRWRVGGLMLKGCPENWGIEALYTKNCPNVFSVKLTVTEPLRMGEEESAVLIGVLKDHALQFHSAQSSRTAMGVCTHETRWGPQQHLNTKSRTLPTGILMPMVTRLVAAMRDAMATRGNKSHDSR
jgi:hypothetical protein